MDAVLNTIPANEIGDTVQTLIPIAADSIDESGDYTRDIPFSLWLNNDEDYIPTVNLKICNTLPNGVYKIVWQQNDFHFCPIRLNTDELYTFSEDLTSKILEETQIFWDRKEIYDKYNFTHKRGLLLVSEPGMGKSSIITLLINQLIKRNGLVFLINNVVDFTNYRDTIKNITRKIEPDRPIITVIEDVDQLISSMNSDTELLELLDGKNSVDHQLIILTSNDTTDLSPALLRPSRIDMVFEIPAPSKQIRYEFFQKKGVLPEQLDLYVTQTDGMSFAEIKEVFIGTQILGKPLDAVIDQIRAPFESKDFLVKTNTIGGLE